MSLIIERNERETIMEPREREAGSENKFSG